MSMTKTPRVLALAALALAVPALSQAQITRQPRTGTVIQPPPNTTLTPVPIAAGPAPTGVAVSGTPAQATVTWQPAPNAVSYNVERWMASNPSCCRNSVTGLSITSWTDGGLQWSGTYVYRVTAVYGNGSAGYVDFSYTRPEPANPTSLTATQKGEGVVELSWPAIPNVSYYLLWGPGLADGTQVTATTHTVQKVPVGTHEYTVASYYMPGPVSTSGTQFTKGHVTVASATGRYRVMVNGFQVNRETADDILNRDGQHDEIYASAFVQVFDRRNKALLRPASTLVTSVHGDVNGAPSRVRAGSATNLGGIQNGDRIPMGTNPGGGATGVPSTTSFPFLLFEGPLTTGVEVLVIRPVLWEADGDREAFNRWQSFFESAAPDATINHGPIQQAIGAQGMTVMEGGVPAKMNAWYKIGFIPCCGQIAPGQDIPIGVKPPDAFGGPGPSWHEKIVVITREQIEGALSSQYVSGAPGIIAIPLADANPNGNASYPGDYVLYLRVERLP